MTDAVLALSGLGAAYLALAAISAAIGIAIEMLT